MSSTFGNLFRVTTFGESHGGAVGCVIDGCPAGQAIDLERIQKQLDRRKPGQSHLSTPRKEADQVQCVSGMEDGRTLGSPVTLLVQNKDANKAHYDDLAKVYRPSHADYTTQMKYGIQASSGGGRASARETIGRVAAAGVAEQILSRLIPDFDVVAWVHAVKDVEGSEPDFDSITRDAVDQTVLRCASKDDFKKMETVIVDAQKAGDSVGGIVRCVIRNCPAGLGEPVFDKLEAELAKAMLSLPAVKGFEIGSGFAGTKMFGSEHNDAFEKRGDTIRTKTNRSGGIQGGISNGEHIYFNVAFKPVATIFKPQETVTREGSETTMKPKAGRHDPCVLPRAVPMVEAMASLVIMDHFLRQSISRCNQG